MKRFINEKVLELLIAAKVPVMTFSEVMMQNPFFAMQLMGNGAAGAYESTNDIILIHDHALTSDICSMTLLHELVHWTGHANRLARPAITARHRTKPIYATEEVTAQLGMFKLAMALGFDRPFYERLLLDYIQPYAPFADFEKAEYDSDTAVNFILGMVAPAQGELFAA